MTQSSTRQTKTSQFWQLQDPTVQRMLLRADGPNLDEAERPEILSYLPNFENKTVLDLGAGIGRLTTEFAKKASGVVAVDFMSHFIQKNREINSQFSNITYLVSDVTDLSFKAHSFDLIFANALFMYIDDAELKLLLPRIAEWLKPSGYLFFRDSCAPKGLHLNDSYYVHYRSLYTYENLMKKTSLTLRKTGSIQAYLNALADPFKCFWLYQK